MPGSKVDPRILAQVQANSRQRRNPNEFMLARPQMGRFASIGALPELPPDPMLELFMQDRQYMPVPYDLAQDMMNPRNRHSAERELLAYPPYRRSMGMIGYPPR